MNRQQVRIGTRASKLALAQAGMMQRAIAAALGAGPDEAEEAAPLIHITTSGDRIQDRRLMEVGGKGLFTKEIEEALLDGRIDCAIHSLKDMPAQLPPGLVIAAIPEREDPRDAFLSERFASLDELPHGARLGTASLRRQAQALHRRPDLQIVMLRGNVDTRLAKLRAGEADAILLAAAGLNRLGLGDLPRMLLDPVEAPPAPGQGALAIETRADDAGQAWLAALRHAPTALAVAAERGAMLALEGSCRTAIGAHAVVTDGGLDLVVEALTPDGARRFRRQGTAEASAGEATARELGLKLGREIAEEGGEALLAPI
ncbi:MAG TPA: hydroxymethylbilane synthase [Caulobacteraceae bacterium]|nr:hydroxymethylbilane synthase [Caulobacteraceae bacterium]